MLVTVDTLQTKKYFVANLPDADTVETGETAFVLDDINGPGLVFSDSEFWYRADNGAKVVEAFDCVMFNGQSNMAAAPNGTKGASAVKRYLMGPVGSINAANDQQGWSYTLGRFVPVVDGGASAKSTSNLPGVGQIGAVVMRRLAEAAQGRKTIYSYALAYSSQNIDYFLPSSATPAFFEDGSQDPSLNNYNLLKAFVAASGRLPKLYVWCQGEANAGTDEATYFAKLETLFLATRADYPGIKWVIIGTIGNAFDRTALPPGMGSGAPVTEVRRAQQRLAEKYADVYFVGNTDMMGSTAHFDGVHYKDYTGYFEVGERVVKVLKSQTWEPVEQTLYYTDTGLSFTDGFTGLRTVALPSLEVTQWQTDIAPNTQVATPLTTGPTQVPFDEDFNYQPTLEFDNADTLRSVGLPAALDWSLWMVSKNNVLGAVMYALVAQDNISSNRAALSVPGQSNKLQAFSQSAGQQDFSSIVPIIDSNKPHMYTFGIDQNSGLLYAWYDGQPFGSVASPLMGNMTEAWLASLIGTSVFQGRVAWWAYTQGIPSDAQVAAVWPWARLKYGIKGSLLIAQ